MLDLTARHYAMLRSIIEKKKKTRTCMDEVRCNGSFMQILFVETAGGARISSPTLLWYS